ncbi:MAG: DUF4148 domain-containing protein [Burkholderiaceae bacterium]
MFAKYSYAAIAALSLIAAGSAFAQTTERNVFDTEAALALPAATSAAGLTRAQVQAEYLAQRDKNGISSFNPESYLKAQNAGAGSAIVAMFQRGERSALPVVASSSGLTRAQVRAEFLAARASGELNPFDTETTDQMATMTKRQAAPSAYAQR